MNNSEFNYHTYMQSLKSAVDTATEHTVADPVLPSTGGPSLTIARKSFTLKNIMWVIGVCLIGISVVAFATQLILLAVHNAKGGADIKTVASQTTDSQNDIYVRAGADKNLFGKTDADTNGTQGVDLGIPGISKIGFDANTPNKALTDNINKYAESTFVIGGREGENGNAGWVGGGDDVTNQGRYSLLSTPLPPVLSGKAYLAADLETGEIILEKDSEVAHPLASVSKLMTAVIAREKMDMQSIAIVSRDASRAYGGQGNLGLGEKIRLADLLFPLLMESSNDAAEVFADQFGHAKFMEEMNKKAAEIGMLDTYYGDPSGLDPQNTATPKDLLTLARYIYKSDPQIYDITRVKQFSIKGHTWLNRNALLTTPGYAGGKNGYIDQSRQTTVSLFDVDLAKGGVRTIVVVVLRSENKNNDVAKLLNYLKKAAIYEVK